MKTEQYVIRDREAGNIIESWNDLDRAIDQVKRFVETDIQEGTFSENFYEIIDTVSENIVYCA
jgi:serine phosphatase RsbU (regulator of sigma subunit)